MTLTLDPRFPLLWRSPDSLQLGVDAPAVVLPTVTLGHERMLAALAVGATAGGMDHLGNQSGLDESELAEFRRIISPALCSPVQPAAATVSVSGHGPTADRVAWRLAEAGLTPLPESGDDGATSRAADEAIDFAVIVSHFVVSPQSWGRWLSLDIPHLPIVYGDTSVRIGPVIEPGVGPCLYCLELHRTDADAAWPTLASQLLGRRSLAETPFVASETATIAVRLVLDHVSPTRQHALGSMRASVTLDVSTGAIQRHEWAQHPECGCREVPNLSAQARREISTVSFGPIVDRQPETTTREDFRVPA